MAKKPSTQYASNQSWKIELDAKFPFMTALLGKKPRIGFLLKTNALCRAGESNISMVETITIPTQVMTTVHRNGKEVIKTEVPTLWEQGSSGNGEQEVRYATVVGSPTGGIISNRDVLKMTHGTDDTVRQALVAVRIGSTVAFGSLYQNDTRILVYKIVGVEALSRDVILQLIPDLDVSSLGDERHATLTLDLIGYYFATWTGSDGAKKDVPAEAAHLVDALQKKLTRPSPYPVNVECFSTIGGSMYNKFESLYNNDILSDGNRPITTVRPSRFMSELKKAIWEYRAELTVNIPASDTTKWTRVHRAVFLEEELFLSGDNVVLQISILCNDLGSTTAPTITEDGVVSIVDVPAELEVVTIRTVLVDKIPEDLLQEQAMLLATTTVVDLKETVVRHQNLVERYETQVVSIPLLSDL